jgi:hypothetical protein
LGLGMVVWFMDDPSNLQSWQMVAFGIFAYFLVIPGLMPTFSTGTGINDLVATN